MTDDDLYSKLSFVPTKDRPTVPRATPDPIQYLMDEHDRTVISIASEWGFKTMDSVYRLKRFDYTPPPSTAAKMAKTFGWTAGEVVDFWLHQSAVRRSA